MKHDWETLKTEYLAGPERSVTEFLKGKGLPTSGAVRGYTRGWGEEKKARLKAIAEKALEDSAEQLAKQRAAEIVDMHKRHSKLGADIVASIQKMIESGEVEDWGAVPQVGMMPYTRKLVPKDFSALAQALRTASQTERAAYGITESNSGAGENSGPGIGRGNSSASIRNLLDRARRLKPRPGAS